MKTERLDIVYLGLQPVLRKSEGLNVLLCDTIRPMKGMGISVVIHTTNRHKDAVVNAMAGNGISLETVQLRVYSVGSLVMKLLLHGERRTERRNWFSESAYNSYRYIEEKIGVPLRSSLYWLIDLTLFNFLIKLMMLICFAVAIGIVASIGLLALGVVGICLLFSRWLHLRVNDIPSLLRRRAPRFWSLLRKCGKKLFDKLIVDAMHELYAREQARFIRQLEKDTSIKKLFFFMAFEGECVRKFKGKSLVVFPDAVTAVFPLRFDGAHNRNVLDSIKMSVKHASAVVCYSRYVRDVQLKKIFPIEISSKKIIVIPQGYFQQKIYSTDERTKLSLKIKLSQRRDIFENLFPELMSERPIVDFTSFDYLIYPTVDRPHKNTLNLVRAFDVLLRKRHRNLKLILTTPSLTGDVRSYIVARRLHYDVIIAPSVQVDVLENLISGAALLVHPSLAEGGDVFNFSRAVSVGCPAIMADVPVVREMFERRGLCYDMYSQWLFNPFCHQALVEKIDEILLNPAACLSLQKEALAELAEYGYPQMAKLYLKALKEL